MYLSELLLHYLKWLQGTPASLEKPLSWPADLSNFQATTDTSCFQVMRKLLRFPQNQSREAEANKKRELVTAGARVREHAMEMPLRGRSRSDSRAYWQDKESNGPSNKKTKICKAEENEEKQEFFELDWKRVLQEEP